MIREISFSELQNSNQGTIVMVNKALYLYCIVSFHVPEQIKNILSTFRSQTTETVLFV